MFGHRSSHILADLSPESAFGRGVLVGVAAYCREHEGVEMVVAQPGTAIIGKPEQVDGIITSITDAARCKAVAKSSVPVVNVSAALETLPCPTVCADSDAIGRLSAEYLLQQGYTNFAYHLESHIAFSRQRHGGFASRLQEAGHSCAVFDTGIRGIVGTIPDRARPATTRWLQGLPKPVGIFTHNDFRALTLLGICREAGIEVPNEVGVIGVDNDSIFCPATKPTLTSVDIASDVIGYRAAAVLTGLIRGVQPTVRTESVPPQGVVERQSTQPAMVDDEVLREATRFIREHATDRITVDDVVRHVSLSRRTLERRFQAHLARSPGDEIRRVQIERARHLLAETSLKLSEVAIASGYGRFTSFATAFLTAQAQTPKEYRAAFRAR